MPRTALRKEQPKIVYDGDPGEVLERLRQLRALKAQLQTIDAERIVERYYNNPVRFVHDAFNFPKGKKPHSYQEDILRAIPEKHRVAFRAMHGAGKTTLDAWIVIWFAVTRTAKGIDWKAVTTAGAWRQLERYLWPEIRLWARRLRWDVLGIDPWREGDQMLSLMLKLETGEAFAVASTDPALIEGAHGQEILYIFDESKSISADIFNSAEGAFSTGIAYAVASSTPGEPMGTFYDIHRRKDGYEDWWTRHITIDEAIEAGAINPEWVTQRRKQWGEKSALFQNRVLGEFAPSDEDGVIPLAWIEAANRRWWDADKPWPELSGIGVDVARSGADDSVIAPRFTDAYRDIIGELKTAHGDDTMVTTGKAGSYLQIRGSIYANVDTDGIGAGVTDRLRELYGDRRVRAFQAAKRTDRKDRTGLNGFMNVRSAAWWNLREMLDPQYDPILALPADDRLTSELTTPHYVIKSDSRIYVESKDEVKKRLDGKSTDAADAVIMACWTEERRAVMTFAGRAA